MIRNFVSLSVGALLLSGCVYPYQSDFEVCDEAAGACYRYCEDAPDEEEGSACRFSCEEEANRCFDEAYRAAEYRSSAYAYQGAWYGSYGYWRPRYGYIYSFDYYDRRGRYYDPYYRRGYGRHGDRYRYNDGRDGRRDGRRGDGRRGDGRGDGRGGRDGRGGQTPPDASPPPPTRVAPPPPPPRAEPPRAPLSPERRGEPKKDD